MGASATETRTFVFTDIEGSTRRWQAHPDAMREALAEHDRLLTQAINAHRGEVFKHTGDGVCAVFDSAGAAVQAAVEAQRAIGAAEWEGLDDGLAVRIGVHSGTAERRDDDWFGPVLNRAARIMGVGHGHQILVSGVTAGLLADETPAGIELVDLGQHRLRDLVGTEHLHQVAAANLMADFPALVTLDAFVHNLPVQRTSFVGRDDDLAATEKRLAASQLVTLAGIGGAGKTRLALELAAQVMHRFGDGVAFVDLGPLGDGDVVPETVAVAAGLVRGGATGPVGDGVGELLSFLARREMLIVLDNCEHLVDDCADLVDQVLARCRDITILATSREPLGVDGEQVVRVGSLPTDGVDDAAARLFDERAAAVDHAWDPIEHRSAVVEICRRLDGLPLAIELAAAQVRYLTPADIAGRLDDRFDLLTGGRRRVQRQQTLEAVLDWSHDLLDATEQMVLRRLAVFAGSFTLDAAEAVVSDGAVRGPQVGRALGALVDKSLVMTVVGDGPSRFRLLETVRLYGLQRLTDAGDAVAARDRHRDHILATLERYDFQDLSDRIELGAELRPDLENFRAAHTWSLRAGRMDLVGRQTAQMAGLYWQWGLADEALEWAAVSAGDRDLAADVGALVWHARGIGAMLAGELTVLREYFDRSVETAESDRLRAHLMSWMALSLAADRSGAIDVLDRASMLVADDDARTLAFNELIRGAVPLFHEDFEAAIEVFERSSHRPAPNSNAGYWWLVWHTTALVLVGRADEALAQLDRSDDLATPWGGYAQAVVRVLAHLEKEERAAAIKWIGVTLDSIHRSGIALADRDAASVLAAVALADGRAEDAASLLSAVRGASDILALRSPASWAIFHTYRRKMFEALGTEAGRAAYRAGRSTDVGDVIALAWGRLQAG